MRLGWGQNKKNSATIKITGRQLYAFRCGVVILSSMQYRNLFNENPVSVLL